jgi:hypothetical protein
LPSLTIGSIDWSVDVSGTGPPVDAVERIGQQPWLLYLVGIVLLLDVTLLISRRGRIRRATTSGAGTVRCAPTPSHLSCVQTRVARPTDFSTQTGCGLAGWRSCSRVDLAAQAQTPVADDHACRPNSRREHHVTRGSRGRRMPGGRR